MQLFKSLKESFVFLLMFACASVFAADAVCPPLTGLQKFAGHVSGYLEWMNFVRLFGILIVVVGVCFIFSGLVKLLIDIFYKYLLEFCLWAAAIGLVVGTNFLPTDYQTWSLVIGSLLIPAAWGFSASIRKVKGDPMMFSVIITLIWGAIALYYQSSPVGFFTVGALMSALGFSIAVTPFCYAFGFNDDQAVARGTVAGFFISVIYLLTRVFKLDLGLLGIFESGALWLASFVFFIGLLITSTKFYWPRTKPSHYGIMNAVAVVGLLGYASLGMLFGVREITTMASVFMIFYFVTKIIEIPTESAISFGFKLLGAGVVVFFIWDTLNANPHIMQRYFMT